MRMSRPSARSLKSELVEPGTRVMSPKVVMVTPGTRDRPITVSMSWLAVTHTGQPGPDMSRRFLGMAERMPLRAMATVWVPQTSIRLTGRSLGVSSSISSMSSRASLGSRKVERSSAIAIRLASRWEV